MMFCDALFDYIKSDNIEAAKKIIFFSDLDFNKVKEKITGYPLFMYSALLENKVIAFDLCKTLIGLGAREDVSESKYNRTAMMVMAANKTFPFRIANLLQTSVNCRDAHGKTALMFSVVGSNGWNNYGNMRITQRLVLFGADVDVVDNSGKSALDYATKANTSGRNDDLIYLLKRFSKK